MRDTWTIPPEGIDRAIGALVEGDVHLWVELPHPEDGHAQVAVVVSSQPLASRGYRYLGIYEGSAGELQEFLAPKPREVRPSGFAPSEIALGDLEDWDNGSYYGP